jgi:hypothetical protein
MTEALQFAPLLVWSLWPRQSRRADLSRATIRDEA